MRQDNKRVISLIFLIISLFVMPIVFSGCESKENQDFKINTEENSEYQISKVSIRAYLNLSGCQTETTDLLDGLVKQYKGQVTVEYIDFSTKEGYERTVKDGLDCAGLVINGKQTYTIMDKNGKQREVTFSHPINYQYTADDVIAVVKQLLDK